MRLYESVYIPFLILACLLLSASNYSVSDEQLVSWFERCKAALRNAISHSSAGMGDSDSVIIVKENVTRVGMREYDTDDRSWTRCVGPLFRDILHSSQTKKLTMPRDA